MIRNWWWTQCLRFDLKSNQLDSHSKNNVLSIWQWKFRLFSLWSKRATTPKRTMLHRCAAYRFNETIHTKKNLQRVATCSRTNCVLFLLTFFFSFLLVSARLFGYVRRWRCCGCRCRRAYRRRPIVLHTQAHKYANSVSNTILLKYRAVCSVREKVVLLICVAFVLRRFYLSNDKPTILKKKIGRRIRDVFTIALNIERPRAALLRSNRQRVWQNTCWDDPRPPGESPKMHRCWF